MNLNNDNIDELMFQLLEGEIQGEERLKLLEAIHADKKYSKQWEAWQQTVLNPDRELILMDTSKLLKKEKRTVLVWWKYSAAAAVVLTVGLCLYYLNTRILLTPHVVEKPGNPKSQIIIVPSISPVGKDKRVNDSTIPLKQKVQMIAGQNNHYIPSKSNGAQENKPQQQREMPPANRVESPENNWVEVPSPLIEKPKNSKEEPVITTKNSKDESDVIMTVYTETNTPDQKPSLNAKIQEKRNLLSRVFSLPKLSIANDSSTLTNKKIVLENKAYKIIAGF